MQTIAELGRGQHFGGGTRVIGDGDLQRSLRVVAAGPLEAYHIPVSTLLKHTDPEFIRQACRVCAVATPVMLVK
jgi:hypothetical protein